VGDNTGTARCTECRRIVSVDILKNFGPFGDKCIPCIKKAEANK